MTNDLLLNKENSGIDSALSSIEELRQIQEAYTKDSNIPDLSSVGKILEDCKLKGTIPFSILARHGLYPKPSLFHCKKKNNR